jgi:hypothetical protein
MLMSKRRVFTITAAPGRSQSDVQGGLLGVHFGHLGPPKAQRYRSCRQGRLGSVHDV